MHKYKLSHFNNYTYDGKLFLLLSTTKKKVQHFRIKQNFHLENTIHHQIFPNNVFYWIRL
ncbi:hypothetical protein HanIR_Chr03g0147531 [Helianthus annuus]|nr:hypothetical protein HanIR_Chr03g0147531 [Helianthus annuus]